MKTKMLLIIAVVFAINVNAQTPERKWGLGIQGGLEQYNGDFGNGFYNFNQPFYGFGGISISRNISEHFDIELNTTLGDIGHENSDYKNHSNVSFSRSMFQFNVNAKYNFFKYDNVKLRPFVFAGLGYLRFADDKRSGREINNMQLPDFGFGLTYKVSPIVSVVFKETFMISDYDRIEYVSGGEHNDSYLQHSIGLVFNLGKAKDTDGDGISDRIDNCPEIAGLALFKGCPDTDGDGITDAEDNCPKTKGLKEFNGCPDTDGDGVADKEDNCPKIKGLKALNGCPDRDNDGVADKDDICPDVAGLLKNKGCPEVKKEEKAVLEKALHGVKFQSGKNIITTSSYSILNNVVSLLKKNSNYKLKIEGHTDSQGNDNMNLELSKNRATAVKNYLIKKGIAANRLSSKGFGEAKPIADNNTSKGRAENRRVELTIGF